MRNHSTRSTWVRRSPRVPEGVPDENWLPINRENIGINGMYRIYAPDVEKMKTWKPPQLEML